MNRQDCLYHFNEGCCRRELAGWAAQLGMGDNQDMGTRTHSRLMIP